MRPRAMGTNIESLFRLLYHLSETMKVNIGSCRSGKRVPRSQRSNIFSVE